MAPLPGSKNISPPPVVAVSTPGNAGAIVQTHFGAAANLVATYEAASTAALDALGEFAPTIPMEAAPTVSGTATSFPYHTTAPTLRELSTDEIPAAVDTYQTFWEVLGLQVPDAAEVSIPGFYEAAPSISLPITPDATLPDIPTDIPALADPEVPSVPSLSFPDAPTLHDITLPASPELENLFFDATAPTLELVAPETEFVWTEADYSSNVADALRDKLYTDIVNGGTGLADDVEQAIYDRAEDRLNYELTKTYNSELANWEAWGQEMPDGVLAANLREVLAEGDRRRAELNRDVMVKQAELAQTNTHFMITSGLVHELQLMNFFNMRMARAFEATKAVWGSAIDLFKAKVDQYNAQMAGYKVAGEVFESRIRAEIARVEIFKAQMDGAKLAGEVQAQQVELYHRRVQAVQTLVEIYKAQVEGAKLVSDLNKARIDGFTATLSAKKAQIDAATASFGMYQAAVSGEKAKVEIFASQVQAYEALVRAKGTEANVAISNAQARIAANENRINVLRSALENYKVDSDRELGLFDAAARVLSAESAVYAAGQDGDAKRHMAEADYFRATVEAAKAGAEVAVANASNNVRSAVDAANIATEGLKAVATITAQKLASALSIINVSASMSQQVSRSDSVSLQNSYSFSEQNSDSVSTTTSTQTSSSNITSDNTNHNISTTG